MSQVYPMIIDIPTVLGNGLRRISMGSEFRIFEVSGNLWALTTGPHTIRVRRALDGSTVGQITWNAAGFQQFLQVDQYMAYDDGLLIDCTALGIGASICTVTLWGVVPGT